MASGREQFRAWIERTRQTQRAVAEQLGITEVFVSQILSGERQPGLETAANLEDLTGIPARSFRLSRLRSESELTAANVRKSGKSSR